MDLFLAIFYSYGEFVLSLILWYATTPPAATPFKKDGTKLNIYMHIPSSLFGSAKSKVFDCCTNISVRSQWAQRFRQFRVKVNKPSVTYEIFNMSSTVTKRFRESLGNSFANRLILLDHYNTESSNITI